MEKERVSETVRQPLVTMLVAVYNAEKYLHQCLESLVNQTLSDIQVICVDDASTDSSWQILQEYAEQDRRFEIVHLSENRGQAYARNVALRMAKGSYIGFLDSDDYLSTDALEKAANIFISNQEIDSVLFHVCYINEDGTSKSYYPMSSFRELKGEEAFEESLTWQIHGIYLVRSSIHQQYPYDDTSRTYSDDNTTRLHYLHSRKVSCCEGIYYYRQHPQSVTHRVSISRFDFLEANSSMKQQLLQANVSDRLISIYENERWINCIGMYLFLCQHRKVFSTKENHEALQKIKTVWRSVEPQRLKFRNRYKFGYLPIKWSWCLFRLQEEMYCRLRIMKESFK